MQQSLLPNQNRRNQQQQEKGSEELITFEQAKVIDQRLKRENRRLAFPGADRGVLRKIGNQLRQVWNVPDTGQHSSHQESVGHIDHARGISPDPLPNANVDDGENQKANKEPFGQETESKREAEYEAGQPFAKSASTSQRHQTRYNPGGQPVIEDCLPRHPYQVGRERRQKTGPSGRFPTGELRGKFVYSPEQKKRGREIRKNRHMRSRMKNQIAQRNNQMDQRGVVAGPVPRRRLRVSARPVIQRVALVHRHIPNRWARVSSQPERMHRPKQKGQQNKVAIVECLRLTIDD